jgi:hypothetical protein
MSEGSGWRHAPSGAFREIHTRDLRGPVSWGAHTLFGWRDDAPQPTPFSDH